MSPIPMRRVPLGYGRAGRRWLSTPNDGRVARSVGSGREDRAPIRNRLRSIGRPQGQAGVDPAQDRQRKARKLELAQRLIAVGRQPLHGRGRRASRHRVVKRHRQSIDVGPGPLLVRPQLLQGRIARREDRGHRRGTIGHRGPRGAKIDQCRIVGGIENDVGRLDVAMEEAGRMDLLQPVEQPVQQLLHHGGGQRPLALQAPFERFAAHERHHHVGRAVGFQEVMDPHHGGHTVERHQDARFLEKAIAAPGKILGELGRAGNDDRLPIAQREHRRQVFLDGDRPAEGGIAGLIGDAERPMAQHRDHLVVPQSRPLWERAVEFFLSGVRLGFSHNLAPHCTAATLLRGIGAAQSRAASRSRRPRPFPEPFSPAGVDRRPTRASVRRVNGPQPVHLSFDTIRLTVIRPTSRLAG